MVKKFCHACKGEIKKGQKTEILFRRTKEEKAAGMENTEKTFHKNRSDCVYKQI